MEVLSQHTEGSSREDTKVVCSVLCHSSSTVAPRLKVVLNEGKFFITWLCIAPKQLCEQLMCSPVCACLNTHSTTSSEVASLSKCYVVLIWEGGEVRIWGGFLKNTQKILLDK